MKNRLQAYRQYRDDLLTSIITDLSDDERFVAAWLTGSYSKNEADSFSDIDLALVVSDQYGTDLCTRLEQVSARTSPERYSLFSQFGNPALIHENNNNAPDGGTFTFVLYAESAVMIDWMLIPQIKATRPFQSRVLFEKTSIPIGSALGPEDLTQSKKYVAEQWAFFWMMNAITIKYTLRGDSVFVTHWLEELHKINDEIERGIDQRPLHYRHGSRTKLQSTREKQMESLIQLCKKMQELKPRVTEFTNSEPFMPLTEIETLLSLAEE